MCVTPASHPVNTDTHTRNEQERERERERVDNRSPFDDYRPIAGNDSPAVVVIIIDVGHHWPPPPFRQCDGAAPGGGGGGGGGGDGGKWKRGRKKFRKKKHPSIDRINSVHTEREKPMKKTDKNKSGWNWTTSWATDDQPGWSRSFFCSFFLKKNVAILIFAERTNTFFAQFVFLLDSSKTSRRHSISERQSSKNWSNCISWGTKKCHFVFF